MILIHFDLTYYLLHYYMIFYYSNDYVMFSHHYLLDNILFLLMLEVGSLCKIMGGCNADYIPVNIMVYYCMLYM